MKTIALIVINSPEIITQEDFNSYQKNDCYFKVYYTDKTKREYNSAEDVIGLDELIAEKSLEAENDGVSAVIVICFADEIIEKAKAALSIPVFSLSRLPLHIASTN